MSVLHQCIKHRKLSGGKQLEMYIEILKLHVNQLHGNLGFLYRKLSGRKQLENIYQGSAYNICLKISNSFTLYEG
jgi:hypothetical protein